MYIVMGVTPNVYGLFADLTGGDAHWESLGKIGSAETVTAISSSDGNTVFVGTDKGNICQLTAPYTSPCVNFVVQPQVGSINGLFEVSASSAFAATASGYVLKLAGQTWKAVGGGLPYDHPFISVDGDPNLDSVFAANTNQVFVTHDQGSTWLSASHGLPTVAQSTELHYVHEPNGIEFMYLASYGWSMFSADLTPGCVPLGGDCSVGVCCPFSFGSPTECTPSGFGTGRTCALYKPPSTCNGRPVPIGIPCKAQWHCCGEDDGWVCGLCR